MSRFYWYGLEKDDPRNKENKMQYRVDRHNNIYIRLNDDGSTLMIKIEDLEITRQLSDKPHKWDLIYNNYSHSNKREFDEAEEKAQI